MSPGLRGSVGAEPWPPPGTHAGTGARNIWGTMLSDMIRCPGQRLAQHNAPNLRTSKDHATCASQLDISASASQVWACQSQ